jgi:hypothetical protein
LMSLQATACIYCLKPSWKLIQVIKINNISDISFLHVIQNYRCYFVNHKM